MISCNALMTTSYLKNVFYKNLFLKGKINDADSNSESRFYWRSIGSSFKDRGFAKEFFRLFSFAFRGISVIFVPVL
ncbi:hypothetical protein EHQ83_09600 [Leptospira yasudae]|uniref:Uncharacterized protein n=1 Tax=Leptospira yasudae TaxID=2202201 RepID=A0A6N4QZ40_9LEPT|nr:hypothetical protein EHQ77_12265 [Leptospira yasudae]TGL84111.1 hypothetical protein EHQ72_01135 [Leptospira yasudae]TGL85027.1 hypothetical protein EHQ83_09600 [Leptospira yasudae]